tara:strand:+ start:5619 stop:6416 length:798 start_codon:yes stop_codon:yes gene_type:complete
MRLTLNINRRIIAKKSLGQNFIHNEEFLSKLSAKIVSNYNTDIIEIGPGTGSLTKYLEKKSFNNLFLIEKDLELSKILSEKFKHEKNIKIYNEDALTFDLSNISKSKEIIIVGNLPFNISSQLLLKWISYNKWPPFYSKMYLMFQKELGKRINSKISNKSYGKLSVLTQSRCDVKELIAAPSHIFKPKPKVDGIVLEFTPIETYIDVDFKKLMFVLKAAFENRRKKIKNSLNDYKFYFDNWEVEQDLRPENIEVKKYCSLAKKIN